MRVLLDACVWGGATAVLHAAGHDVEWVGDWSGDPGDERILATAAAHGQALVTLDKDFGESAVLHQRPHAGIVRLVNLRAQDQGRVPLFSVVTGRNLGADTTFGRPRSGGGGRPPHSCVP